MNNFNLDDFFAAFKSMRTSGASASSLRGCGSCGNSMPTQQYLPQQAYDSPDETITYAPQNNCQGFTCRHTPTQEPCPQPTQPTYCQPQPQPTQPTYCQPQPQPTQPTCCQPPVQQPVQRGCGQRSFAPQFQTTTNTNFSMNLNYTENHNSGIIDGPGNDIYDNGGNDIYGMGNRGIIDTDGNDIYARNYSINTFNTTNNFYRQEVIKPDPTVEPTIEPTIEPDPTDPSKPDPVSVDLMPLRNLLTLMDGYNPNGILEDNEIDRASNNPSVADLDGNNENISSEELSIFNRIKNLNADKNLITSVMQGDYSSISESTLNELADISAAIKRLASN